MGLIRERSAQPVDVIGWAYKRAEPWPIARPRLGASFGPNPPNKFSSVDCLAKMCGLSGGSPYQCDCRSLLTNSFPGRDIIPFDMNNLDKIVERIPGKETRTKW